VPAGQAWRTGSRTGPAGSRTAKVGNKVNAVQRVIGHASVCHDARAYAGLFGDNLDAWRTSGTDDPRASADLMRT
jgi:hypothetical protein